VGSRMKTIAVIAFAHSGTTMLAGILEIFGVPMVGNNYLGMNWEDQDIIKSLKGRDGKFAKLVERRNRQHSTWGFKHPGAHNFLDQLDYSLRNPIYLSIWKDPMSVTQRRKGYVKEPFVPNMRETCLKMDRAMEHINDSGLNVRMLSYSQALARPRTFVERLASMTGIAVTGAKIDEAAKFIQPNRTNDWRSRYMQVKKHRGV